MSKKRAKNKFGLIFLSQRELNFNTFVNIFDIFNEQYLFIFILKINLIDMLPHFLIQPSIECSFASFAFVSSSRQSFRKSFFSSLKAEIN